MVCALPAFAALRQAFPSAHIAVLASRLNAPIIEADANVSEIIIFDRAGPGLYALALRVRRARYDAVLVMRTATYTNLLAAASGAPRRIGYDGKPGSRWLSDTLPGGHGRAREVDRSARLAESLAASACDVEPAIRLTDAERAWASDWLVAHGVFDATPTVGVHPGGSTSDKCYPEDRYGRAASELCREMGDGARAIVFGGPGDDARVMAVLATVDTPAMRADRLPLRRMIALIARVGLMLVNDSGPMHIAAAVGTPLVAVFGPTDHVRWMPRADAAKLVMADDSRPGALPVGPGESSVRRIPAEWIVAAGLGALGRRR